MKANESVDMAKAAIAVLLFCLLIGATIMFFWMLYDNTDSRIKTMERATTSSNMDRIYELRDESQTNGTHFERLPLVTNIVSALTGFNEEDLLFVYVNYPDTNLGFNDCIYSYGDVFISTTGYSSTLQKSSDTPVTELCRDLLRYSNCRCSVTIGSYNVNSGELVMTDTGDGLTFLRIDIYNVDITTTGGTT